MPHAEAQVAFGAPGHVPAAPVRRLARDLELLMGQLGADDDILLVRGVTDPAHLQRLHSWGLAAPRCQVAELDHHVLPRASPLRSEQAQPAPWAWTPDSCAFFQPLARRGAMVPAWTKERAACWSKAWSAGLLSALVSEGLDLPACDLPRVASDVAAVQGALAAMAGEGCRTAVIKASLASSGRGAIRVAARGHPWTTSETGWLRRSLERQGAVTVSPWRRRLADLSVQLTVGPQVTIKGITGLQCDALGRYLGNPIEPPELLPREQGMLEAIGRHVGEQLRRAGHFGPAGIDAMRYLDDDGAVRLQPLLEVNARTTMGHVALALRAKLPPGVSAHLCTLGPRDLGPRPPLEVAERLQRRYPPQVEGGGLTRGVVPLNDPAAARAHLALLIVGEPSLTARMSPAAAWLGDGGSDAGA